MATLYEMQDKLKKYNALKENLRYVVNYINNCVDNLQPSVNNFLTAYSVDETSKGYELLSSNLKKMINRRDTINNTIIPEINFEITKLKKDIEEEQARLT